MINKKESECLTVLKIIFCFQIIVLHMHSQMPLLESMPDYGSTLFSIQQFIRSFFSTFFVKVAVPGFAFIPGYLFFTTSAFNGKIYHEKIHKRFFSLVIPYFTWVLVVVAGDILLALMGKNNLITTTDWNLFNILNIFWGIKSNGAGFCPYNGPMWYMRDLFIMALLSPIVWILLKHKIIRYIYLLFCFALWIYPIILPPHETIFLFFFSLGAFFPISKNDLFKISSILVKNFVWIFCLSFSLIAIVLNEFSLVSIPRDLIVKIFIVFIFPCYISFGLHFFHNEPFLKLGKATFVIYCMHNIVLAIFGEATLGMSSAVNLLYYFLLPIATFLLGYAIYLALDKTNNSLLSLLFLGKRLKKNA